MIADYALGGDAKLLRTRPPDRHDAEGLGAEGTPAPRDDEHGLVHGPHLRKRRWRRNENQSDNGTKFHHRVNLPGLDGEVHRRAR